MSELEQIVRPSQEGAIRPGPISGYQAPPVVKDATVITWGTSGSNIFQLSAHASQQINNPWPKSDETHRKYDIIKVKNPDDDTQHVFVEAMTEYNARNSIDKSRTTLRYASQTSSANVEVISTGNVRRQPGAP